ncbi:MAG: nucleotidyltransferase substrate binding protein [Oscillospiraceae bacterium]|nr:nucleotidyltransferase substrate binding protein [Oscillospiraceae bacterium]
MEKDIRWKQRFQNLEKAEKLLAEIVDFDENSPKLEREGFIQRFEVTFELAWKTLKDFLDYLGNNIPTITPRSVVKEAFSAGVIEGGQVFIDMLESRNTMSHLYDEEKFNEIFAKIKNEYQPVISKLCDYLREQL